MNPLKSLGKRLTEEDQVTKLLYALKGSNWTQKRSIIEATQNLKTMTFEGLMGNLKAHEVQLGVDSEFLRKLLLSLKARSHLKKEIWPSRP